MRQAVLVLVLVAALVPWPATAAITATASAAPSGSVVAGQAVQLEFTKRTTSLTDGAQAGTVRVHITGPSSTTLAAKAYTMPAELAGDVETFTWTWTPSVPGFYTLRFNDTISQGAERDATISNYQVLAPPPFVPRWPAPYTTYDNAGQRVDRAWGDLVLVDGALNVTARNHLRVPNPTGQPAVVVVAFLEPLRNGAGSIPLEGNVAFSSSLGDDAPGTPTQLATSHDATASFLLPPGETLWLSYVVRSLPTGLASGPYSAPFTVAFLQEETA